MRLALSIHQKILALSAFIALTLSACGATDSSDAFDFSGEVPIENSKLTFRR